MLIVYAGAYFYLLRPMEVSPGLHLRIYAIDQNRARTIFAPLEIIDRSLRPGYWICEGQEIAIR